MNIEVQIYVSNFIKFFKDNPEDLEGLIGDKSADDFFVLVKERAELNSEEGIDIELTQKQLIDIILVLNQMNFISDEKIEEILNEPFWETKFGKVFLN